MFYELFSISQFQWTFLWPTMIALIFLYVVYCSKYHINQNHKPVTTFYYLKLSYFVSSSFLLFPVILPLVFLAKIYRNNVDKRLKEIHKQCYGGLLKGGDSTWALEKNSKSIINVLLIVEYDKEDDDKESLKETFTKLLEEKMKSKKEEGAKLLCSLEKKGPYFYLLKNKIEIKDCVKSIEMERNWSEIELRQYVSKISTLKLPKNHKALWEVNVGEKRVEYWNQTEKNYYPIIFRFHHSLLDGSTFLKFFVSFLGEQKPNLDLNQNVSESEKKPIEPTIEINSSKKSWKKLKDLLRHVIWFLPHLGVLSCRKDDRNILNTEQALSNEAELRWISEDGFDYIKMIKIIKNKLEGVTFSDIISTAISCSLEKYFQKNSKIPDNITAALPIIPKIPELEHIVPGQYEVDKVYFENNFSMIVTNLPIPSRTKSRTGEPLVDKLLQMNENSIAAKNSIEPRGNYWIMSFLGSYVPAPILTRSLDFALRSTTAAVSNLQGPKTIRFSNKILVKDVVFWVPLQLNTGVGFTILTYENRLQLGLIVDRSLVKYPEDIDNLLKDTLHYLKLLFEKVQKI